MTPADKAKSGQQPGPSANSDPEREAIRASLLDLIAERGYLEIQLSDLLERAALDAAGFEHHYPSLDACFAELCQGYFQESAERTLAAYAAEDGWRDGMRAQVWEAYRFLSEDHLRARVCVIEANFGGEMVLGIRDLFMSAYIELIHLGRLEAPGREDIAKTRAEAIVGASWELIAGPIKEQDFDRLVDAVPQILYLLFLPYLGPEIAEEELRRGRDAVAGRRQDET